MTDTQGSSQQRSILNINRIPWGVLLIIATMLLSAVLFTVGTIWWESRKINVPAATSVGWDIRALTQQPLFLLILILGFAAGFYWEFTRVSR